MKALLTHLFLLISISQFAQGIYENGYYIDNNNAKKECLILNNFKQNSPNKITIKSDDKEKSILVDTIKEFGIGSDLDVRALRVTFQPSVSTGFVLYNFGLEVRYEPYRRPLSNEYEGYI